MEVEEEGGGGQPGVPARNLPTTYLTYLTNSSRVPSPALAPTYLVPSCLLPGPSVSLGALLWASVHTVHNPPVHASNQSAVFFCLMGVGLRRGACTP